MVYQGLYNVCKFSCTFYLNQLIWQCRFLWCFHEFWWLLGALNIHNWNGNLTTFKFSCHFSTINNNGESLFKMESFSIYSFGLNNIQILMFQIFFMKCHNLSQLQQTRNCVWNFTECHLTNHTWHTCHGPTGVISV